MFLKKHRDVFRRGSQWLTDHYIRLFSNKLEYPKQTGRDVLRRMFRL